MLGYFCNSNICESSYLGEGEGQKYCVLRFLQDEILLSSQIGSCAPNFKPAKIKLQLLCNDQNGHQVNRVYRGSLQNLCFIL